MTDRTRFRDAALASARQEVPETLEWIPWRDVPSVRWRDDGTLVDAVVVRGWLVKAALRDDPTPDDEMRRSSALLDDEDTMTLASWLLDQWIAHDTDVPVPITHRRKDDLRAIATKAAELATRLGRGGTDPEERYDGLLVQEANRAAPSALPYQGMLALVAAYADRGPESDVARQVHCYLNTHREARPAQCRALERMMAWVPRPDWPTG